MTGFNGAKRTITSNEKEKTTGFGLVTKLKHLTARNHKSRRQQLQLHRVGIRKDRCKYFPIRKKGFDWHSDLPRINTLSNFIAFFKKHGYERCKSQKPEKGFEKIALFEKNSEPTHACRLIKKDLWTSKLGILEDVQHSLEAISGGLYGEPAVFLKRKI